VALALVVAWGSCWGGLVVAVAGVGVGTVVVCRGMLVPEGWGVLVVMGVWGGWVALVVAWVVVVAWALVVVVAEGAHQVAVVGVAVPGWVVVWLVGEEVVVVLGVGGGQVVVMGLVLGLVVVMGAG
jgi:hypothetical protein